MGDCFVHASDLHLDAPLGSLGLLDKQRRAELASRAAKAWDNLVDLCIDKKASFLVLAGDIFDDAVAGVGVQLSFHRGLRRLTDDGTRVFVCHGNHDPLSEGFKPVGELPEDVVRFPAGWPESHTVELRNSGDHVRVSGVSFGTRRETQNLALRFRALTAGPDVPHAPHVAVLHANVGRNSGHDPYAPCSYDDLDGVGVDYWALGHIHKRDVHRLPGGAYASYCGNLQGRSFKPSECEPKGALVVPVDHGRIGEPRFESCDSVRFVRSDIQITPTDSIVEVQDRLLDAATKLGASHHPCPVVWEARLTGTSGDSARLRKAVDDDLVKDLSDDLSERLGDGGLCGLEAAVRTASDRDAVLSGGDLRADVLRDLQRLRRPRADARTGEARPESAIAATSADESLQAGLPSSLVKAWQSILDERPERREDLLDLAEELLLAAYARAEEPS